MAETYSVSLEKLIEQMELENVTSDVDVSRIDIVQTDVNRPALQLAGFFDYFDSGRIQIIGHVEHTYMEQKGLDYTLDDGDHHGGQRASHKAAVHRVLP